MTLNRTNSNTIYFVRHACYNLQDLCYQVTIVSHQKDFQGMIYFNVKINFKNYFSSDCPS